MTTINDISKYKVIWAEFTPAKGIVTKHDQKAFGAVITWEKQKTFRKHFSSKEKAIEYIKKFDKKLDKHYSVRLFTDAQFSNATEKDGYAIKYTKKQIKETYTV
jgi:hypothetical protein